MADTKIQLEAANSGGTLEDLSIETVKIRPLSSPPTHHTGQLWYDDEHKAVTAQMDIEGVNLNIGQEFMVRVINDTGSTIPNGTVVTIDGVDTTEHLIKVKPAIATSFNDALVVGVTTNEILDGEIGYATSDGVVHDIDTTGLSLGVVLYLSDTVAGGLTDTPPDIVSRVCMVIKVGATDGAIYVRQTSNVVFPTLFASLDGQTNTYNLTTTSQNIDTYTNEDSISMTASATTGYIQPPETGKYRATVNMTATVPSSTATREAYLELYDVTDATVVFTSAITVAKDATTISRSFPVPFDATAGSNYVMRIKADTTINGVTLDSMTFDIESIHVR